MNQTAFKDADINTVARNLAKEYNLKGNRLTQLEMDFVAFAYNYHQSRLSAILTKIEELPTKEYKALYPKDPTATWLNKSDVKSLIEEELSQ